MIDNFQTMNMEINQFMNEPNSLVQIFFTNLSSFLIRLAPPACRTRQIFEMFLPISN